MNDIFIVKNEQVKRAVWKMGRVVGLLTGNDASIRAARIEVSSNNGKQVLQRSLKHLVPLEVCSMQDQSVSPAAQSQAKRPQTQSQAK